MQCTYCVLKNCVGQHKICFKCAQWLGEKQISFSEVAEFKPLSSLRAVAVKACQCWLLPISGLVSQCGCVRQMPALGCAGLGQQEQEDEHPWICTGLCSGSSIEAAGCAPSGAQAANNSAAIL